MPLTPGYALRCYHQRRMKFARTTVSLDQGTKLEVGSWRPGRWLVEAGTTPPPEHRPALLLGDMAADTGMALTLRTASALHLDMSLALIGWMGSQGCPLPEGADVAFYEVLLNAAIHGNLRVASGPSKTWRDLEVRGVQLAEALHDPARAGRVVTAAIAWNISVAVLAVADEGPGYTLGDQPAEAAMSERRGAGKGLAIARALARLEVCNHGRCTRMIFTRAGHA